ncbi:hypothetical protein SISSUDRAFT_1057766 [Sistotremastrum suecicum HHB10207 ss-3]|uniref:Uncharacterized protein n=1 Tax=Sistotremastrum suecicum HHB10207 ss-3 TaxID=1314776 RepID=A0A166I3T1_9AGAM|nr:hypothetical protein SISSUDRAFT_1057766 [Sistotremastrum suecicum HHB10207 ss-3]
MGRRPNALRTEASEYTSLIRVLNTQSTLDLTAHLDPRLSSPKKVLGKRKRTRKNETAEAEDTPPPDDGSFTRWPLMSQHIYAPRWGFEEEIAVLAKEVLQTSHPERDADQSNDVDDDEDTDSSNTYALVSSATHLLRQLLSLLAAHAPQYSMQHRVGPMSWDMILDIGEANGLFDHSLAESVRRRMSLVMDVVHEDTDRFAPVRKARQRAAQLADDLGALDCLPHV